MAVPDVPHNPAGPLAGAVTGWAPYGSGQHASAQIGRFSGTLLNQYPALVPGVQLANGRAGNNPGWYTPAVIGAPVDPTFRTQQDARLNGGQRYGSRYTGGYGPVNVKQFQGNLAAAQLRQSGMSSFPWAAGLTTRFTDGSTSA